MLGRLRDYLILVFAKMIFGYLGMAIAIVLCFVTLFFYEGFDEAKISMLSAFKSFFFTNIVIYAPLVLSWIDLGKPKSAMPTDTMSFAEKQLLGYYP